MICPYIMERTEQVNQICRDFDDEKGIEVGNQLKLVEQRVPLECKKAECGAWYKSESDKKARCHYYG
jgi:hypothetical protein